MSRSVASNILDVTQLFMVAGVALGVWWLWDKREVIGDWLNPYPEIREVMETSPMGRFLLRIEDAREPIGQAGLFPYTLEFPDFWVFLRSLPMPAPSPGFQLSDLYGHTAETGPSMGAGGGQAWFTP